MAKPQPEALPTKEDALFFIEINIDTEAAKIEVVKNSDDDGYLGTAGPHPQ